MNSPAVVAIKDVRDSRQSKSPTVEELHRYVEGFKKHGFTIGEIETVVGCYEEIIEYLVERLVHSESERFSK